MTILLLETLAANAWPAAEMQLLDGWQLRHTQGVTRRANSVWPNIALAALPLAEKLRHVEDFYARHHLPARYQISPATQPADLDEFLALRGYRRVASSAVQVAELSTVLTQTPALQKTPEFELEVAEQFDEGWFEAYAEFDALAAQELTVRRAILQRISADRGFVLLRINGIAAAVGLGVVEDDWLGIFCMTTHPDFRRRGAASAILRTLSIWAQLYGARQAYLQVMDDNAPAQRVYARAGFVTLYHYHYREQG